MMIKIKTMLSVTLAFVLIMDSCEEGLSDLGGSERIEFEKKYTETVKKDEFYSKRRLFYDFSENYVKATINFDSSNLYGSLGNVDCDGDWNKTTGILLPGSIDPHANSGRFVHRVSEDLQRLELGHYTHRTGYLYSTDSIGNIIDTTYVNDVISDYIMDVEIGKDYLVEVIHNVDESFMKYYVEDRLVAVIPIPKMTNGAYNLLHLYHGGTCPAPHDVILYVTYHKK